VHGGISFNISDLNGCANGGAGTVWYKPVDRLTVNNNNSISLAQTFLHPSTP